MLSILLIFLVSAKEMKEAEKKGKKAGLFTKGTGTMGPSALMTPRDPWPPVLAIDGTSTSGLRRIESDEVRIDVSIFKLNMI